MVAHRTNRGDRGGVERGWDSLVAPRTMRGDMGGIERGWDSMVTLKFLNILVFPSSLRIIQALQFWMNLNFLGL